jgi:glycosyltransferase involved in cell wall biosynthesis
LIQFKIIDLKKTIYIVHPFRQHNFEQASELSRVYGNQVKLVTSFFIPAFLLKLPFFRKHKDNLKNRSIDNFRFSNVYFFPLLFLFFKLGKLNIDTFRRKFTLKSISKIKKDSIIIGYDCSSFEIFTKFKDKAVLILDLTIALENFSLKVNPDDYNRKINLNEQTLKSEYFQNKLGELDLADIILVGSKFVQNSVIDIHPQFESKTRILPYGFYPQFWRNNNVRDFNENKLNVVFVGTASYRKGFQIILKMIKENPNIFDNINFTLCGNIDNEFSEVLTEIPQVKSKGFLNPKELNLEMNNSHLLILPSFLEGSSITVYQAMATGLPCIVTEHTGSVISHEQDGLICRIGDPKDLYEKILWANTNRKHLKVISENAENRIKHYTWEAYGNNLSQIINELEN